jgi:hypothetical protein
MAVARDTPFRPVWAATRSGQSTAALPGTVSNACESASRRQTVLVPLKARVLAGGGWQACRRRRGRVPGYGGQVSIDQAGGGEQCPACGESDLRPYGNGSKWACPRCHFILPCCEGGELAGLPSADRRSGVLADGAGQLPSN